MSLNGVEPPVDYLDHVGGSEGDQAVVLQGVWILDVRIGAPYLHVTCVCGEIVSVRSFVSGLHAFLRS